MAQARSSWIDSIPDGRGLGPGGTLGNSTTARGSSLCCLCRGGNHPEPGLAGYHYTLLLIPIAILAADLRSDEALAPRLLLGMAMAPIGLDLSYLKLGTAGGPITLLGYPKLYGAWLLWGLALGRSLSEKGAPQSDAAGLAAGARDLPRSECDYSPRNGSSVSG